MIKDKNDQGIFVCEKCRKDFQGIKADPEVIDGITYIENTYCSLRCSLAKECLESWSSGCWKISKNWGWNIRYCHKNYSPMSAALEIKYGEKRNAIEMCPKQDMDKCYNPDHLQPINKDKELMEELKKLKFEDKFNQMFNAKILAQIVECAVVNDHDKAIELSKKLILPK